MECAQLGISELVTNALLHAEAPISVRLRGTVEHPRVEVSDGSDSPPVLSAPTDARTSTTCWPPSAAGLDIVAMCAVAWGATIEQDGKCIWFEPARAPHQGVCPEAELLLVDDDAIPRRSPRRRLPTAAAPDRHRDLPVAQLTDFRRHYRELRRELRLLSLAHQDDYPLAQDLTEVFHRFERSFPSSLRRSTSTPSGSGADDLRPAPRPRPVAPPP